MKIDIDKDWCLRMAALEGDAVIGAGSRAFDPVFEDEVAQTTAKEETGVAFGRFVRLMRRQRQLTVERLADDADIDVSELVLIEDDPHFKPDTRTVYQLAQTFGVPPGSLLQVSGRTVPRNDRLIQEAVRFAARSEPIVALTREEQAALDAFVVVLSEQK